MSYENVSNIIDLIKLFEPVITIGTVVLTAYLAYRNTIKNSINQEKINEYTEILDMLYDLKSNRFIFLYDLKYIERLKKNRAKIKLFSNKNLFNEINNVYSKMEDQKREYENLQKEEPMSLEECEKYDEEIEKYGLPDEFISDEIDKIVNMMRKELKVKGRIK